MYTFETTIPYVIVISKVSKLIIVKIGKIMYY